MDRQEYLNQISASNRPVNTKPNGKFASILSSKVFLIAAGAVILFILLAVIGGVLSGSKSSPKQKIYAFTMHIDNTTEAFDGYRDKVKSSGIRSYYTTLSSLLVNVKGQLESYLSAKNGDNKDDAKKILGEKKIQQLDLERDALINELFEAKINGNLDRVFENKMSYEIATMMNEESDIAKSSGDESLKEIMANSYTSLENLYNQINNISEPNN